MMLFRRSILAFAFLGAVTNNVDKAFASPLEGDEDSSSFNPLEVFGYASSSPKLDPMLSQLFDEASSTATTGEDGRKLLFLDPPKDMLMSSNGDVIVEIIVSEGTDVDNLVHILEESGEFKSTGCAANECSIKTNVLALSDLEAFSEVKKVMANYAATNSGSVTSEASQSMFSDLARSQYNTDGSGVKVCVLSDSFDSQGFGADADILSGDLPAMSTMDIRSDIPNGIDEGRAMMQLIHDVSPGATLAFHSAVTGFASFAAKIKDFVDNAGCHVIVDDIIYFVENPYQDDLIAQASNYASEMGVPYFSSAGNQARQAMEVPFKINPTKIFGYDVLDFDGSPSITYTSTRPDCFSLSAWHWAEPSAIGSQPGPSLNLIALVEVGGALIFDVASAYPVWPAGVFGLSECAPVTVYFLLADAAFFPLSSTPTTLPPLFRMTFFEGVSFAAGTPGTGAGTSYGHANSRGAISIGAAPWINTPGFGISPAIIESFSSAGGVPIIFDENGMPLDKIEVRQNPAVVGPDGTCTTFFGPQLGPPFCAHSFFGTSASAPNVAAVAALMLDVNPTLDADEIRDCLECTYFWCLTTLNRNV